MALGERLKELRTDRNVSLSDIHRQEGMATGYLSRVEHGKQVPSAENVRALAGFLGATEDEVKDLLRERNLDLFERKLAEAWSLLDGEQRAAFLEHPTEFLQERVGDAPAANGAQTA